MYEFQTEDLNKHGIKAFLDIFNSKELHSKLDSEICDTKLFLGLMNRHNKMALKCVELEKENDRLRNMPIKDHNIITEMIELKKERNSLMAKNADLTRKNTRLENEKEEYYIKMVSAKYALKQLTSIHETMKTNYEKLLTFFNTHI